MKTMYTLPVDMKKLRDALKKRGPLSRLSRELGYSQNFFTNVLARGYMSPSAAQLLELKFGIKYDDYKPAPKPEPMAEQITYDFEHTKYRFSREITTADIVAELIEIRELLKQIKGGTNGNNI